MAKIPFRIRPAIVLFGDSITEQGFGWEGASGWVSLLSSAYSRRADVLNRGFSGYNTNHAIELLPRVFPPTESNIEVLFATVFFGANDSVLEGESQHVPLDQYEKNLKTIVSQIRNQKSDEQFPIILITPPPLDDEAWEKEKGSRSRSNDNSREYGKVVKKVAQELECLVLDTFELLGGNGPVSGYAHYLRDGLHLSGSGNELVYSGLMKLLTTQLPHLAPMVEGEGRYGSEGVALEEKLWTELVEE